MSTRTLTCSYENNYKESLFPATDIVAGTGPWMPTGPALRQRMRTIGLQFTTAVIVDGKPIRAIALLTHEDAVWLRYELRRLLRGEPEAT